ncbi:hypothetical protein [Desulfogranum japonicum]|uniref:hypothetical protein n=1 Tax=Desulfogranum japonicum TaxID=231447 RepID=UPI00048F2CDD|nr:hypothetical protein [Desulfogranum japonicum]
MKWQPIKEEEIWDDLNQSWKRMSYEQRNLWEVIKIIPEKWKQDPWGNAGDGFWVVAIIGKTVVWYNDIEEGYNRSTYSEYGKIEEYWCDQDELEWAIQKIINEIKDGYVSDPKFGPPIKGEYKKNT